MASRKVILNACFSIWKWFELFLKVPLPSFFVGGGVGGGILNWNLTEIKMVVYFEKEVKLKKTWKRIHCFDEYIKILWIKPENLIFGHNF